MSVYAGVDTHKDFHHIVLINELGTKLGSEKFTTTSKGYLQAVEYMNSFEASHGVLIAVGMEGTGSYGKAFSLVLQAHGIQVFDIPHPSKRQLATQGKTDTLDAYSAANMVVNGQAQATAKESTPELEIIEALYLTRRLHLEIKTSLIVTIKSLLVKAPAQVRDQFRDMKTVQLMKTLQALRPANPGTDPSDAYKLMLKEHTKQWQTSTDIVKQKDKTLEAIITQYCQPLLEVNYVGVVVATELLISVGSNMSRFANERKFAAYGGISPLPAISGRKTNKYRYNPSGKRLVNKAIHQIAVGRKKHDQTTKNYIAKKISQGKTPKEAIRALKRHISREIYKTLKTNLT